MASGNDSHHIIPFKTYLSVLLILLGMTIVTVIAARIDFGHLNAFIAMGIASFKAALVLLYFMHLKYDDKFYWAILGTGIFFLLVMFFFSELDIVTRVIYHSPL